MNFICRGALFALGLAVSFATQAQSWPAQPIRAYIPFGAGSATDIIPRTLFDAMSKELGQTITVENKGGAGGAQGDAEDKGLLPPQEAAQTAQIGLAERSVRGRQRRRSGRWLRRRRGGFGFFAEEHRYSKRTTLWHCGDDTPLWLLPR